MSIRDDDRQWLFAQCHLFARSHEEWLKLSNEEIEQFCDRVEAAVNRDDEPRWVAREFEFKAMMNNDN
jgi:hypothetical protein